MNTATCPYCFQSEGECYLICPTQCPWGGDQALEDAQSQPDGHSFDKGNVFYDDDL